MSVNNADNEEYEKASSTLTFGVTTAVRDRPLDPSRAGERDRVPATADGWRYTGNLHSRSRWILPVILAIQAVLSLRLVWSNTAFPDEALYLWAGHQEWEHWLHGATIEQFQTFFSGAPVLYPPLGAIADSIGGLAGARLLSLAFLLGATILLHGVTRRIFDSRSAAFASALFAGSSAVGYLGAFATYDAMALFLITLATWLGVRAAGSRRRVQFALYIAAAGTLVLADATKYAAALFTPVVLVLITLLAWWCQGGRGAFLAGIHMTWSLALIGAGAIAAGGPSYWHGIASTTLARQASTYTPQFLLYISAKWTGAIAVLAILGALAVAFRARNRAATLIGCLLAVAVFLVPIEQARIHTYTSLFKHIGYGDWFGAIVAGYCLASFPSAVAPAKAMQALRISALAAILVSLPNIPLASSHFGWPDTTPVMPVMQRGLTATAGPVLADDRGNVLDYYLPTDLQNHPISGTFFFAYNDASSGKHLTGQAAYSAAIHHRYFAVIFLEFWDSVEPDQWVQGDIRRFGGYRLVAAIPYRATGNHGDAMIWVRS